MTQLAPQQGPHVDTHHVIHGRPHERTMERHAFDTLIADFTHENKVSTATSEWFEHRFLDELDRRRSLEGIWRRVFWSTRYLILSGSLILPVLITASKSVTWLNLLGIVVSIIVALATAMEALLRSGRKWRLYRQGADMFSTEGAAFFQMIGLYTQADPVKRLNTFKERIEANIQDVHESYAADIDIMASQNAVGSSPDKPS
jgi:Protein of unknown function (DUF4231)